LISVTRGSDPEPVISSVARNAFEVTVSDGTISGLQVMLEVLENRADTEKTFVMVAAGDVISGEGDGGGGSVRSLRKAVGRSEGRGESPYSRQSAVAFQ
jgi:hypothetical protein